jgi:hypothetical protein
VSFSKSTGARAATVPDVSKPLHPRVHRMRSKANLASMVRDADVSELCYSHTLSLCIPDTGNIFNGPAFAASRSAKVGQCEGSRCAGPVHTCTHAADS